MVSDINYWSKVFKRIFSLAFTLLILFVVMKLSIFYLPFLIAFVLALLIEPGIKFLMKHFKWTRRISSTIIIFISVSILICIIICGATSLFNEASKLLQGSDNYFKKIENLINSIVNNESIVKKLPEELYNAIINTEQDILSSIGGLITNILTNIKNWIIQIPNLMFTFFFSLMALFFMCTDKIYIIDQIEHHLPDIWTRKLTKHLREINKKLGHYLKAQATLISISFFISLIGLTVFKLCGLNVPFPLLMALAIGFIDALPILGSSAVMIPWAIIEALNGDYVLAIALIILLSVMGIVRNILEPRLVSKHIGIHPVFTLIAMYTGYKLIGVIGLIIGPILLIVLKEIYTPLIDKGVFRSLFERGE